MLVLPHQRASWRLLDISLCNIHKRRQRKQAAGDVLYVRKDACRHRAGGHSRKEHVEYLAEERILCFELVMKRRSALDSAVRQIGARGDARAQQRCRTSQAVQTLAQRLLLYRHLCPGEDQKHLAQRPLAAAHTGVFIWAFFYQTVSPGSCQVPRHRQSEQQVCGRPVPKPTVPHQMSW